ncbi:hypothetical protein C162_03132 [Paenibacillus sp. FSL R7-269]|uniref:hypothetical protein n=1 Tax=Paenibacillus sp. FSL R7-269 TaxID=1226755 RepID=UPI0003E23E27|nr:hypothetical protein [Paenibacillus sp. FSL R7-269]ETT55416.1 hypothetical protein C162_03132 [Paenibacillus sp. FSL R7-269]
MSVSVIILTPQNEYEKSFFIPIAGEASFYKCWVPGIQALGLKWLACFQVGLDAKLEDLPNIFAELDQLKKWANLNLNGDEKDHFFSRANLLEEQLPTAFQRKDAVAFIG